MRTGLNTCLRSLFTILFATLFSVPQNTRFFFSIYADRPKEGRYYARLGTMPKLCKTLSNLIRFAVFLDSPYLSVAFVHGA